MENIHASRSPLCPKSLGADPESSQADILAGLLGFFRRQFWVGFQEFGRRRLLVAGFGDDFDERGFFRGMLRLRGRFRHARQRQGNQKVRCDSELGRIRRKSIDQSGSMN